MKQIRILLFLVILLAACDNSETDQGESDKQRLSEEDKVISETDAGDFVLQLVSEKMSYKPDEEIYLKGKLKYIGDKDELEIAHSESPFFFDMIEVNRGIEIPYFVNEIGRTTILRTNQWFEEPFEKNKVHSISLDEHTDFFRIFADENGLPIGEYEIELRTDFHTAIEEESEQHHYITSIVIEVKE